MISIFFKIGADDFIKESAGKWEKLLMSKKLSKPSIDRLTQSGIYKSPQEYTRKAISGIIRDYQDFSNRHGFLAKVFSTSAAPSKGTRREINVYLDRLFATPEWDMGLRRMARKYFPKLVNQYGEGGAAEIIRRSYKKMIFDRLKSGEELKSFSVVSPASRISMIGVPTAGSKLMDAAISLHEALENKSQIKSILKSKAKSSFEMSHASPEVIDVEKRFLERMKKLYPSEEKDIAQSYLMSHRQNEEYATLDRLKKHNIPLTTPGTHIYTDEAGNLVFSSHPSPADIRTELSLIENYINKITNKQKPVNKKVLNKDTVGKYLRYYEGLQNPISESFSRHAIRNLLKAKKSEPKKVLPLPG